MSHIVSPNNFYPRYVPGYLYFGPEIEVDGKSGVDQHRAMQQITTLMGNKLEFKGDASLSHGFEMNVYPMTYKYIMNQPWDEFFKILRKNGYLEDVETTGLHIHVSRNALGPDPTRTAASMAMFCDHFWSQVSKLSRRSLRSQRYAGRPNTFGFSDRDVVSKARGKSCAINTCPEATVEFRLFKGTIDPIKFISAIQFTREVVKYCKEYDYKEVKEKDWDSFSRRCEKYPELSGYLRSYNLHYIAPPEPIPMSMPMNVALKPINTPKVVSTQQSTVASIIAEMTKTPTEPVKSVLDRPTAPERVWLNA